MIERIELTLESIKDLDDGKILRAFQQEIRRACLDCMDRPMEKKPRLVTLCLELWPVPEEGGEVERCEGEFKMLLKLPTRKSKVYSFSTTKKGHLAFNRDCPDAVDQHALPFVRDLRGDVQDVSGK